MFENIRERYFPLVLPDDIIIQPVGRTTYSSVQSTLMPQVFPHWDQGKRFQAPGDRLEQVMRLRAIMNKVHREQFIFYHHETPIGWSTGRHGKSPHLSHEQYRRFARLSSQRRLHHICEDSAGLHQGHRI